VSGAGLNLKNKAGFSAIKRAAMGGQQAVVELLQEAGATDEGGGEE
jgi:ankyrin repeat protein